MYLEESPGEAGSGEKAPNIEDKSLREGRVWKQLGQWQGYAPPESSVGPTCQCPHLWPLSQPSMQKAAALRPLH